MSWRTLWRRLTSSATPASADSPVERELSIGEYQPLYRYLRDRYADRVVLTFSEIEALLGFALPAAARLQQEWWSGSDADASMLANRSARIWPAAGNVVFDRRA